MSPYRINQIKNKEQIWIEFASSKNKMKTHDCNICNSQYNKTFNKMFHSATNETYPFFQGEQVELYYYIMILGQVFFKHQEKMYMGYFHMFSKESREKILENRFYLNRMDMY